MSHISGKLLYDNYTIGHQINIKKNISLPIFDHLIKIFPHVFKNKIQLVIFSDYFFQFHNIRMIQFSQRLQNKQQKLSEILFHFGRRLQILPLTSVARTQYNSTYSSP